jgi:hypothetical protein
MGIFAVAHRVRTFNLSKDKRFVEKMQDIVGLTGLECAAIT